MDSKVLKPQEKEESEKLKKEFESRGIDDLHDSLEDLKAIFMAITESSREMTKSENNAKNQKKNSSSSNNFVSDATIKRESFLETANEQPKPSCSYITHNSNPESTNFSKKPNRYNIMMESDISDDDTRKHQISQRKKHSKQKLLRWRINPLDSHSDQNDVPLQQPNRPQAQERIPFRFCKDACYVEKSNEVMGKLSTHLKTMADLWHSLHGSTQTKFQWGTPIQVCTSTLPCSHYSCL